MTPSTSQLFTALNKTISLLNPDNIPPERKAILQPLVNYIQNKVTSKQHIRLNFICTHNSRRSHLAQIWAQTVATYYNIPNVFCYSGGTQATAMFGTVAHTLTNSGFNINIIAEMPNPIYSIKYAANGHPIIAFSKTYDDGFNPESEFAAILTCTQADGACPFIAGAESRIPITYEDPKAYDSTPQQVQKYEERSLQIATEMQYVFSQIKK